MAYTDIDDPSEYFTTTLYTGNGTTPRSITGLGFQPDLLWFKSRNSADAHFLYDTNRGVHLSIRSNGSNAESSNTEGVKSFDSDGWTMGNFEQGNFNGNNYVNWGWKCTASTSSNTDGTITSTVQANTDAGFSIVTYTGNATGGATVGHGLGIKPQFIIVKNRTDGSNWEVYSEALDNTGNTYLSLNGTVGGESDFNMFNDTAPTTSVFSVGTRNETNGSSDNIVAYCFAEKQGYSKFGSYVGNGSSTDNAFVYLGFKPAWVMIKSSSISENWVIRDNKRDPYNHVYHQLLANSANSEDTTNDGRYKMDFLSNGFKIRANHATTGQSGVTYIYMAMAEHPFVNSNGVPTTAR